MWNAYKKLDRLDTALKSRGLNPQELSIDDLLATLRRRGMPDHEMNPFVYTLIKYLEPPGCCMSHCKYYGNSTSPMNCGSGKIPGRCKIYRDYLKRREQHNSEAK